MKYYKLALSTTGVDGFLNSRMTFVVHSCGGEINVYRKQLEKSITGAQSDTRTGVLVKELEFEVVAETNYFGLAASGAESYYEAFMFRLSGTGLIGNLQPQVADKTINVTQNNDKSLTLQFYSATDPASNDSSLPLKYSAYFVTEGTGYDNTTMTLLTPCGVRQAKAAGFAQLAFPYTALGTTSVLTITTPQFSQEAYLQLQVVVNSSLGYETTYSPVRVYLTFTQATQGSPRWEVVIIVSIIAIAFALVLLYFIAVHPTMKKWWKTKQKNAAAEEENEDEFDDIEDDSDDETEALRPARPEGSSVKAKREGTSMSGKSRNGGMYGVLLGAMAKEAQQARRAGNS